VSATAPADPAKAPRANRDPRELQRKRQLLDAPHVAPLTDLVRALSAERGVTVPWFDPTEAATEARILMLFENPGRRADAAQGSGFISPDNDDKSAENMWGFLREAGIDRRRDVVAWNIVPWYLGDDRKIGEVRANDIAEARPALLRLLGLLPELRVVILFGRKAQAGWSRARPPSDALVLETPHPSGRWLNSHPEDRAVIVATLREALRLAGA
jgi:uracil-DNA glycosylase